MFVYLNTFFDIVEHRRDVVISIKSIKLVCPTNDMDCLMHEAVNVEYIMCNSLFEWLSHILKLLEPATIVTISGNGRLLHPIMRALGITTTRATLKSLRNTKMCPRDGV